MPDKSGSERANEVAVLRRKLDAQYIERLAHLETRLDNLDDRIHAELSTLDTRIEHKLMQAESRIAEKSMDGAVTLAFRHLGVDVEDPKDLERFRSDLRFGGVFRDATERGFRAVIAAIFGAIGVSVWMVFKDHIDIHALLRWMTHFVFGNK